jgi:hypothetical protein
VEVIRLKNGTEEAKPLVAVTMMSLEHVMDERPLALYDLVMMCRDHDYEPFGTNGDYLKDLRLVEQNGSIHDSIRNIVLSAVKGDGIDMVLGSPVA